MKHSTTHCAAILALLLAAAATASAQTTFPESEPNSAKPDANVVSCMVAGDMITGTTTGAVTGVGNGNPDTADYYKISTCALPLGIYEHTLTFTTSTPGQGGSIRGLNQTGTPGSGGTPTAGSDVVAQNGGVTANLQKWYGFGKSEVLYLRRVGTAATTGSYTDTLSTASITPTVIGPFVAGTITIDGTGQGHATDTEFWVYDGTLTAIPTFGSDDPYPVPGVYGVPGVLTRTYAPGTYYLAMSTWNVANDQPAPADEFATIAVLMDFPDVVLESVDYPILPQNCAFAVTDSAGTTPVATTKTAAMEILWFKFDVASTAPGAAYCDPGAGGVIACPCGNAPGGSGMGCNNSGATGGAAISGAGTAQISADSVVISATGIASSTGSCAGSTGNLLCICLQGDGDIPGGTPFNDGVRCIGGTLKRLETALSSSGTFTSTVPIASTSAGLGDTIGSGGNFTRRYQVWHRDPCGTFACAATSNVSNAYSIVWAP